MRIMLSIILCWSAVTVLCQEAPIQPLPAKSKKLILGVQAGLGWGFADERYLFNTSAIPTVDYRLKNNFFIQFAPQYSWQWKWNEHYLTLPIHLRKKFGSSFSLFAGPALTFDIGYFKDFGISGGAYYHFSRNDALSISTYTFTLYDYDIDYLYVPVTISYRVSF